MPWFNHLSSLQSASQEAAHLAERIWINQESRLCFYLFSEHWLYVRNFWLCSSNGVDESRAYYPEWSKSE